MAKKPKTDTRKDKLSLNEVLKFVDAGETEVWDALNEEQQKKDITFFTLNRYLSAIERGTSKEQMGAVIATNMYFNKNFFTLGNREPKLQWMLACMVNRHNKGKIHRHRWIPMKKSTGGTNTKAINFLKTIYPNMKLDEVELLARISTKKELQQLAKDHGKENVTF